MGTDDKMYDILYDQLKAGHAEISKTLVIVDQLKQANLDKTLSCNNTKIKFLTALNKLTALLNSTQSQTESLIKEIATVKSIVGDHDKQLFVLNEKQEAMLKSNKIEEKVDAKLAKYEPIRIYIAALGIILVGGATLLVNWEKALVVLKKIFQ